MTNVDLEKIIASTEVAIRQAYALGRRDALDHVARWAQTEETTPTHLALAAPPEPAAKPEDSAGGVSALAPAPAPSVRAAPEPTPTPRPRGIGALLLDYVYPSN